MFKVFKYFYISFFWCFAVKNGSSPINWKQIGQM